MTDLTHRVAASMDRGFQEGLAIGEHAPLGVAFFVVGILFVVCVAALAYGAWAIVQALNTDARIGRRH